MRYPRAVRWFALALVAGVLLIAPRAARAGDAGAVALLPLDADARLEIYGQPVASEVARALVAGGIDVVVVGPKMGVPERAQLIVDGKISAGKSDAVVLSLRIRDRESGTVLDTLTSTAAALTSIDQAAADLSSHALPAVRARLAARVAKPPTSPTGEAPAHAPPVPHASPAVLVAVSSSAGDALADQLRTQVAAATDAWLTARHVRPATATAPELGRAFAVQTVARTQANAGIALEVLGYHVEHGAVPLARARVRVRVAGAEGILFERVIVTDTIVGDHSAPAGRMEARVAREVLAILAPILARQIADGGTP